MKKTIVHFALDFVMVLALVAVAGVQMTSPAGESCAVSAVDSTWLLAVNKPTKPGPSGPTLPPDPWEPI